MKKNNNKTTIKEIENGKEQKSIITEFKNEIIDDYAVSIWERYTKKLVKIDELLSELEQDDAIFLIVTQLFDSCRKENKDAIPAIEKFLEKTIDNMDKYIEIHKHLID